MIVEFRRKNLAGQFSGHDLPLIRIEKPVGRVVIYKKAADLLGLKDGDAVMFSGDRAKSKLYIYKEIPKKDSYIAKIADTTRPYFRFTSKQLVVDLCDFLSLKFNKESVYLELNPVQDEQGRFQLTNRSI